MGTDLLRGDLLRLAPLVRADAADMARWYQDGEYMRLMDAAIAMPRSVEDVEGMIDEWRKKGRVFAFRRIADDALVGAGGYDDILPSHRVAWIAIGLGREYWGQGYGTEAMRLMLRFGFTELNLHKVQLTVFSYNERAQALYRGLGFQQEGVFREYLWRDGERHDMILMGLLVREWQEGRSADEG